MLEIESIFNNNPPMQVTLNTRKPIDQLKPEDFSVYPIWEFATDEEGAEEQDETWVRPLAAQAIGPDLYSLSVAAQFTTASGQAIEGFVGITTAGNFDFESAVLLHQGKYIFVPSPEFSDFENERKIVAAALHLGESHVFPLSFTLRVPVQGETKPRGGEFK